MVSVGLGVQWSSLELSRLRSVTFILHLNANQQAEPLTNETYTAQDLRTTIPGYTTMSATAKGISKSPSRVWHSSPVPASQSRTVLSWELEARS